MNLEFFIAKRIHFRQDRKNVSRPAVRIATLGIALGITVMLLTIAIVTGFKREIRMKTIGFGGHIQISKIDMVNNYQYLPMEMNDTLRKTLTDVPGVKQVQGFATHPGILKTPEAFQGMVLKGVGKDFDWNFFKSQLVEGDLIRTDGELKNDAIISNEMAKLLQLKVGDSFLAYFIQQPIRARKFNVKGIYSTHIVEYDKLYILTDIRHIQQLYNWDSSKVSGIEMLVNDYDRMNDVNLNVQQALNDNRKDTTQMYFSRTIKDTHPQIFAWLDMLDMNVWVILILLLAVAGFNMISGLLILILERTTLIGILKSVGATNWSVQKVFIYHSLFLIGKGMFWGNLIGLLLCTMQYYTHIVPLDADSYYVAYVPIYFNWLYIFLLNLGTFIASVLIMLGPSFLITKILPARIFRYE